MVNSPLVRPYFLGGGIGEAPLDCHDRRSNGWNSGKWKNGMNGVSATRMRESHIVYLYSLFVSLWPLIFWTWIYMMKIDEMIKPLKTCF